MLVRSVIIYDQVQLEALWCFPIDLFHEGQLLLMLVLSFNAADQPTLQVFHRRKECERTMTNIVMG